MKSTVLESYNIDSNRTLVLAFGNTKIDHSNLNPVESKPFSTYTFGV